MHEGLNRQRKRGTAKGRVVYYIFHDKKVKETCINGIRRRIRIRDAIFFMHANLKHA